MKWAVLDHSCSHCREPIFLGRDGRDRVKLLVPPKRRSILLLALAVVAIVLVLVYIGIVLEEVKR